MENNILDLICIAIFFLFFSFIIKLIIYVVETKGKDIFTLDFIEIMKTIDKEPIYKFSAILISFDFPQMFGVILPPACAVKGFYVKVLIYNDYIIVKLFKNAILIKDKGTISLSKKFFGQMSIENNSHSVQLALSAGQYNKIQEWLNNN